MATLNLISLYCQETEDWTGADEPYLRVNGVEVWSGSLNDQESVPIGIDISFNQWANIQLFDEDFGWFDNDDFLGNVQVTTEQVGQGELPAYFTGDGANYVLHYEVIA
jgi:hypothetical protein